jgi:hypothetical protein
MRRGPRLDESLMRWRLATVAAALLALPGAAAAQSTDRLYQEACDAGEVLACNLFGLMLETGRGVPRDLARAGTLYRLACEGGAAVGCMNLGRLYQAGAGVAADTVRASGLYQVACEAGDLLGCDLWAEVALADVPEGDARYYKPGFVRDAETGAPLADAVVEVPAFGARSISDASGRVALAGLPVGRHRLLAERSGYDVLESEIEIPGLPQFAVLLTQSSGVDPRAAGQVAGRVVDETDAPLSNVEVSVMGQEDARTLSNGQGNFAIRGVAPGLLAVRFLRIGYVPRTATVMLQPETTVEVGVSLAIEPIELDAVEVVVRSRNLVQSGFYDRAEAGWGTHFRPSDLERLHPVLVSDALRARVPGVRVEQDVVGGRARLVSRRSFSVSAQECPLQVYIDGLLVGTWDIDLFPAEMIEAIEVYQGVETPTQYLTDSCGAVLIWTKRAN